MSGPRKDQQALLNRSISLDNVIHPRGCLDPNCLLPLCINMKLQKSHLETCKKKPGSCDICKNVKSGQEQGEMMTNAHALVRTPLTPVNLKKISSKQTSTYTSKDQGDEDISIIKVVTGNKKRENNLPEAHPCSQQIVTGDIVQSNQKTLEQASCTAVIPHDKTAISCIFPHQEQMRPSALQFNTNLNSDINTCNQVTQPPLEVLCNALQALNTVTKLAKSSQLELHVIPLLEQVLADMKLTALNRLNEKKRPAPLPLINTSFVMEYCESNEAGNQLLPMQSSTLPTPPTTPPTPPTPPTSSSQVTSARSAVTTWQSPMTEVSASSMAFPYKTKSNSTLDIYGDVITDEFGFDQDIMLFDVDELLG